MDRTGTGKRRMAAWALMAAWSGLATAGCGKTADEPIGGAGPPSSVKQGGDGGSVPRIVLVSNGNSDWWSAVEKGMKDGGAKFGAEVELKRNDGSVEGQIRLLEDALSIADVKGVAVSVVEAKAPGIADAMRKIKESGKAIITIDSDIVESAAKETRSAYIGTNNMKAGEVAGKAAATLRPQGGKVAAFVGTASAANARDRLEGFFAGAGPKFTKPPVEVFEDNADMNTAQRLAETSITKYPDVGVMLGLYSYNAPRIAAEVAKSPEFRKKTTIVTFDLDEQTVGHIEKRDIDVSVCQNPYEIGYQSIRLLKALIGDDKATLEAALPKGTDIMDIPVRVIVPGADSPIKGEGVTPIVEMKKWLIEKGLKSS